MLFLLPKYLITAAQVRLCVLSMQTSYKPAILLHPFSLSPPADSPWARSVRCWCRPCSSAPCCGSCSSSPCAWSSSSSSRTTAGCLSLTARCPPQPKSGWSVWLLLLSLLLFFQSVFFCFYLCLVKFILDLDVGFSIPFYIGFLHTILFSVRRWCGSFLAGSLCSTATRVCCQTCRFLPSKTQ